MPIEDFFKITVQSWGTGQNDCLSRVAQTSLNNAGKTEEAGSWSKIEAQQTKIQNYNNEKEGHEIQKVDVVEDGQEILIPIDDAIAGLKADFDQKSAEYTELLKVESKITGELSASNDVVSSALKSLNGANGAYNSIISNSQASDEERKNAEDKLKEAKAAYAEAVQNQKEKADELKKYKQEMAETQKAINELKSEIQKYTDKKEKTEEGIDKDLEELNKTLLMDEEEIKTAQNELDKLQKQMQEQQAEWKKQQDATDAAQKDATNGMRTVKELGFANENGEVISKEEASKAELDSERLSHGSVKDVQMGREKVVTYEDGTKYTYHRGADGKLSDKPTITKTDGTTATGQAAAQSETNKARDEYVNSLDSNLYDNTKVQEYLANNPNATVDDLKAQAANGAFGKGGSVDENAVEDAILAAKNNEQYSSDYVNGLYDELAEATKIGNNLTSQQKSEKVVEINAKLEEYKKNIDDAQALADQIGDPSKRGNDTYYNTLYNMASRYGIDFVAEAKYSPEDNAIETTKELATKTNNCVTNFNAVYQEFMNTAFKEGVRNTDFDRVKNELMSCHTMIQNSDIYGNVQLHLLENIDDIESATKKAKAIIEQNKG